MANDTAELTLWVRAWLLAIVAGLTALFVVAGRIDPYDVQGNAVSHGTHRQLGLPPCYFMHLFGRPCPHCGMTTSFALLVRADVVGSVRANFVGTLLAAVSLATIAWAVLSVCRGRWTGVKPTETVVLLGIIGFVGLALLRWAIVVGMPWLFGYS